MDVRCAVKGVTFLEIGVGDVKTGTKKGIPILGEMYKRAHQLYPGGKTFTYVNSDCITTQKFVETADALVATGKQFLGVGRRTNVPWRVDMEFGKFDFQQAFNRGELFASNAQDYFITSPNAWDWDKEVPEFVVGRIGYDNWLVDYAYHHPATRLVDTTRTIPMIHQTGKRGNSEGHSSDQANKMHNHDLANKKAGSRATKSWHDHGSTTHSQWVTDEDDSGTIVITKRTARLNDGKRHTCGGTAKQGRYKGQSCQLAYNEQYKENKNADRWCESVSGCTLL